MSAIARDPPRIDFDLVREAFDRTSVGLVVITPEGVFREVNQAFCDITGYSRTELEGQTFRVFTHRDDIARDDEQLRAIRGGADVPSVEKRYIRKGGGDVWVRRSAAPMRDPSGQLRFIVGAFIDLTEQRQKDRELNKLNGFLTAIVENTPIAIYTTDRDGLINFWNPAAER